MQIFALTSHSVPDEQDPASESRYYISTDNSERAQLLFFISFIPL